MLLDNNFLNDRRVYRTVKELAEHNYEITLLCNKEQGLIDEEVVKGVKLIRKFDAKFYEFKNRKAIKDVAAEIVNEYHFDIIHAHDQYMLNLGAEIKKISGKPLIYDSHEFAINDIPNQSLSSIKLKKNT